MFDRTRAFFDMLALLKRARRVPKIRRRSNPAGHFPRKSGQGPQECARRVRQVQRFHLTSSNGLVPLVREEWHQRFGVDS